MEDMMIYMCVCVVNAEEEDLSSQRLCDPKKFRELVRSDVDLPLP